MANADAINKVIASIRGEIESTKDVGFNMSYPIENDRTDLSGRGCGTIACIAGHAYILKVEKNPAMLAKTFNWSDLFSTASDELELDYEDSQLLFFGNDVDLDENVVDLDDITPDQAIRTLEHLRDTGEVDWTV